jgi:hypothetical protein
MRINIYFPCMAGRIRPPAVEVSPHAKLATSPSRAVVARLPLPLTDALDHLAATANAFTSGRRIVRSRLLAALIVATPVRAQPVRRLLDAYARVTVAAASLRAADSDGVFRYPRHPAGPRTGAGSTRDDVLPHQTVQQARPTRATALFLPLAVSERLDRICGVLDVATGALSADGRPSRQTAMAAVIHGAAGMSGAELLGVLSAYEGCRVRRAVSGPLNKHGMLTFERYGPGPRPPSIKRATTPTRKP